jgi:dihydrofolate synthase / folylpolyglutamate synthase
MSTRTLADWLAYQERLHPSTIELGLERLSRVLVRLDWKQPSCPVITVGGTNGKGSCVALLESILSSAGYRVGTFTSPHLIRYNERIRLAGQEATDAALVAAFERIEAARGDISLTFFEFNALAALLVFETAGLDVIVLEVGLGGRLDAVNVVDADVAVVTSVALDHCEWLGNDVDSIGREKAGIFRANRTAIFGSREMPAGVASVAQQRGAKLQRLGQDFDYTFDDTFNNGAVASTWIWRSTGVEYADLPFPALQGVMQLENASAAIAAARALQHRLPVARDALATGLRSVRLAARFQILKRRAPYDVGAGPIEWIVDVAHNPAAATTLSRNLAAHACVGRTLAVCGMFTDKDVPGVIAAMRDEVDAWIVTGIDGARALAPALLAKALEASNCEVAYVAPDVRTACAQAEALAERNDRIVAFGSFHTAGPVLEWLSANGWD